MSVTALKHEEFENLLHPFSLKSKKCAVALSGGPDSMALGFLLVQWASEVGACVHLLHVDHALRAESAEEAQRIGEWVADWKGAVVFHVLSWEHEGADARIQEEARNARYDLMIEYCKAHGIDTLFLAHHQDDQAETVLFRLAKGSGLDGLAGMRAQQDRGGVILCRPFLTVPKARLIATCEERGVPYLNDPSNENDDFARVRLRAAREVLEAEGLTNKRLAVTAKRVARARGALEEIANRVYEECVLFKNTNRIEFNIKRLLEQPDEIVLRCVLNGFSNLRVDAPYAPRFEKVEEIVSDLLRGGAFR